MQNIFTPSGNPPEANDYQVPSYLLAADNHTLANSGASWFDPTTWGTRATNGLKMASVSLLSGAAQLYNSGATIGNLFGVNIQDVDIDRMITKLDSNLGEYYTENKEAADVLGFVAGSLVPGIAGIKVFNAGQRALQAASKTGVVGTNLSRATGLLVPKTEQYIARAAQDINQASATFSALTQNGLRALASGVHQQALEAVAFEVAVQATMFKSPVLESQTAGDIATNLFAGAAIGGVIGGAFSGVGIYSKIMTNVKEYELANKINTARVLQQELNNPAINAIRNKMDVERNIFPAPLAADATAEEVALYTSRLRDAELRAVRIENDIRSNINDLAKGSDFTASNMVADAIKGLDADSTMGALLHADQITRVGTRTSVETEQAAAVKAGKPNDKLQVNYVKLTGEGAGVVTDTEPLVLRLADRAKADDNGSLVSGVMNLVKGYKFRIGALWDAASMAKANSHLEAEARYIWARNLQKLPDDFKIHMNDIPLLEVALEKGKMSVKLVDDTGQVVQNGFSSRDELWKYLVNVKEDVANSLMVKRAFEGKEDISITSEAAARITNTKLGRLDRTAVGNDLDDYLAHDSANKEYAKFRADRKLEAKDIDVSFLPSYAKVTRKIPERWESGVDINNFVVDGATWIKIQEKLYNDAVNNVLAKATGDLYNLIPEFTESQAWTANRAGAGAKIGAFASGGYNSMEAAVNAYGGLTSKVMEKFKKITSDTFESPLTALGRNQEAAIEFDTINQKVTRSGKQWVRHTDDMEGNEYLISKEADAALAKDETALLDDFEEGVDKISIVNPEVSSAIDAMIERSGWRTDTWRELAAAQGKENVKDTRVFRPVRPDPKDYPSYAFVKDDRVTGQGHTVMLFAADAAKLQQLGNKAEQAGYRVLYADDINAFKQAERSYEYQRTLHENYIDSDLKNRGIYSELYTKTNPQKIVEGILRQHLREDEVLARELMRAKNQKVFDFLEDQGNAYSRIESSSFKRVSASELEKVGNNPYLDYIKTALNISKAPEMHLLYSANKLLDESVSKVVGSIREVWNSTRTPYEADKINDLLGKYGMNTGYRDAAMDLLVNHTAPKGELTKFVRSANAILSNLTLGLDPLNALVNAISSNVLRGTELKHITDAIAAGDSKLAGKLADLAKIQLPTGDSILSPAKLYYNAQRNFFGPEKDALIKRYLDAEYIVGDVSKFHNIVDEFALRGTETVEGLNGRLQKGYQLAKEITEKGRTLTGNKWSEDYNRFISADVMRQLTDLAEEAGLMTRAESHVYINTFMNRVEGNMVASQRPLMFQGPIGNAVGLFQSYQFNMMQNLFRYVAEGKAKDMAMLLGLQGTFFGLNGLPGFQFINQHIVGTASGNKNHVDLYDITYGAAGKQAGDLYMYGMASNLLRANIYSRGDLNPRHVTLIPTSVQEVPFVGAFGKLLGSMKESVSKMANGGAVWESLLQGLEHNGVSRPLAGMAQVLQATGPEGKVYSTTNKGTILFSNDFASWASLVRVAGGRPMDEAIVNDGVFRIHSYQQYDRDKMKTLIESVKTTSIGGNVPDEDSVIKFASKYAQYGGKQVNFNRWMLETMKNANVNEAQKITSQLQNPFAKKVQVLMGGEDE